MRFLTNNAFKFYLFVFLLFSLVNISFSIENFNSSFVFQGVTFLDKSNSSNVNIYLFNTTTSNFSNLKNNLVLEIYNHNFEIRTYLNKNITLRFTQKKDFNIRILYFSNGFKTIYLKRFFYNMNNSNINSSFEETITDILLKNNFKIELRNDYIYICFINDTYKSIFNLKYSSFKSEILFVSNNLTYSAYGYNKSCYRVLDSDINSKKFSKINLDSLVFYNYSFVLSFHLNKSINLNNINNLNSKVIKHKSNGNSNNKNNLSLDIYFGNVSYNKTSGKLEVVINTTKEIDDFYVFKLFYNTNSSFKEVSLILPVKNLKKTFYLRNFTNYYIVLDYFNSLMENCKSNNIFFYKGNYSKKCVEKSIIENKNTIKKNVLKDSNSSLKDNKIIKNGLSHIISSYHSSHHHSSPQGFSKEKLIKVNIDKNLNNNFNSVNSSFSFGKNNTKKNVYFNSFGENKQKVILSNSSKNFINNLNNTKLNKYITFKTYKLLNNKRKNIFFNQTFNRIDNNTNDKNIAKEYERAGKTLYLFSGLLTLALLMRF